MGTYVRQVRKYVRQNPTEADSPQRERVSLLREIASLCAAGLSQDEAESVVGIEIGDEPLTTNVFYLPTPKQVAEMCIELQASWSPEERRRRQVVADVVPWEAPEISTRGLVA